MLVGVSFAPPPLSPRVGNLLNDLNLNDYHDLMFEQEIDLTVLAQLSEEQLSRMGVRTMGQRIRILNAARDASASSEVNQNQGDELSENSEEEGEEEEEGPASDEDEREEEEGQDIGDDSEGEEEDEEELANNEGVEEARDISIDGIFTLDPETGINTVVFDGQGIEDSDRIIALSHPEVCRKFRKRK